MIDVTRLVARRLQGRLPTGVDRVGLAYIEYFRERALALVRFAGAWIFLSHRDSDRLFLLLLDAGASGGAKLRFWVAKNLLTQRLIEKPRGGILLNTGHSGLDTTDYGMRIQAFGLQSVFFVHDVIPLTHPEYCRAGESGRHRLRIDTVLRHGRGLIVNSEFTLGCLQEYSRRASCALPPHVVAPLAPPSFPEAEPNAPVDGAYFLLLGTLEPRKNHWLVLQVWRDLIARLGNATPRLVIVGQIGWNSENVIDLLERCDAIKSHVIHKPRCSDAELVTWLRHARALIFPSFVEGYGLPLVEALSLGVPAIASDLPAFREIAGNIPEYLSPIDGVGWRDMVIEYSREGSVWRASQMARLTEFSIPSWKSHFSLAETLLERVDASLA